MFLCTRGFVVLQLSHSVALCVGGFVVPCHWYYELILLWCSIPLCLSSFRSLRLGVISAPCPSVSFFVSCPSVSVSFFRSGFLALWCSGCGSVFIAKCLALWCSGFLFFRLLVFFSHLHFNSFPVYLLSFGYVPLWICGCVIVRLCYFPVLRTLIVFPLCVFATCLSSTSSIVVSRAVCLPAVLLLLPLPFLMFLILFEISIAVRYF